MARGKIGGSMTSAGRLHKRRRPPGQCRRCHDAGLTTAESKRLGCEACAQAAAAPRRRSRVA